MTPLQKLEVRQSERRQRLNELGGLDQLDDAQRSELDTLSGEYGDGERQYRALKVAEHAETAAAADEPPAEDADRAELRAKCRVSSFLRARLENRAMTGPEAELAAELGTDGIPLELWEPTAADLEKRAALEKRAVAGIPTSGLGVNLDLIRPAVFAPSILPRLGVEMPRVPSGTYSTATISGSLTARSHERGHASAGTAATFDVGTASPKRISARLELRLEDIAAIGQDNYESALRQNLALALSAELDDQGLNGTGSTASNAKDLVGLFQRLTDPSDPSDVVDFDAFVAAFVDQVDGLWSRTASEVAVVAGVETYRLAGKTFRDTPSNGGNNETAFTDYAMAHYGGFWTNARMPDPASDIQQAIAYRQGRSAMGASEAMRTAACPVWSEVMIDDIYTGSAKAERYVTFHVLLGDVLVVQPDAYKQIAFKVA